MINHEILKKRSVNKVWTKRKQKMINELTPLMDQNIPVICSTYKREQIAFAYNLLMFRALHGYFDNYSCKDMEEYEKEALRANANIAKSYRKIQRGALVRSITPPLMIRDRKPDNRTKEAVSDEIPAGSANNGRPVIDMESINNMNHPEFDAHLKELKQLFRRSRKLGENPPPSTSDRIRAELKQVSAEDREQLLKQLLLEQAELEAYEDDAAIDMRLLDDTDTLEQMEQLRRTASEERENPLAEWRELSQKDKDDLINTKEVQP